MSIPVDVGMLCPKVRDVRLLGRSQPAVKAAIVAGLDEIVGVRLDVSRALPAGLGAAALIGASLSRDRKPRSDRMSHPRVLRTRTLRLGLMERRRNDHASGVHARAFKVQAAHARSSGMHDRSSGGPEAVV